MKFYIDIESDITNKSMDIVNSVATQLIFYKRILTILNEQGRIKGNQLRHILGEGDITLSRLGSCINRLKSVNYVSVTNVKYIEITDQGANYLSFLNRLTAL